jgi:hypothetical protein
MVGAQNSDPTIRGSATVRSKAKSGNPKLPKGYGAMKGRISFRADIDLTKPIAAQVFKARPAGGKRDPQIAPAA